MHNRNKNKIKLDVIRSYFASHKHIPSDTLPYLTINWDNDVGFRVIPDYYLSKLLRELYIMRHHPVYKEIKEQINANEKRKIDLQSMMVLWTSKNPPINMIGNSRRSYFNVGEVQILSSHKIYEPFTVSESFLFKNNVVQQYIQYKETQNQCWYCEESSYFGHVQTLEHKEMYLAYIQSLSASLSLPEEIVEQIMHFLYRK